MCNVKCLTLNMFHVKRLQTSEAVINSFIDISEVQQVGSEGAKHSRANAAPILVWALLSPRMSDTKCPNNLSCRT